jgi:hypothetical protein
MENKRKSKFDQIKEENYEIKVQEQPDQNSSFVNDVNTLNNHVMENTIEKIKEFITPETIPVGIMATMVKEQIKRNKDSGRPFVPYQQLDINNVPTININQTPSHSVVTKLENFYKFYNKIK